jgi:hypothetical protein
MVGGQRWVDNYNFAGVLPAACAGGCRMYVREVRANRVLLCFAARSLHHAVTA